MNIRISISGDTGDYEFTRDVEVLNGDHDPNNYMEIAKIVNTLTDLHTEAQAALKSISRKRAKGL